MNLRTPQARLRAFTMISKDKKQCECIDNFEPGNNAWSRNGCGNAQPKITRNGLKLFAEFANTVDDETVRGKQTLEASQVIFFYSVFACVNDFCVATRPAGLSNTETNYGRRLQNAGT